LDAKGDMGARGREWRIRISADESKCRMASSEAVPNLAAYSELERSAAEKDVERGFVIKPAANRLNPSRKLTGRKGEN
jgi:hypothetical protein